MKTPGQHWAAAALLSLLNVAAGVYAFVFALTYLVLEPDGCEPAVCGSDEAVALGVGALGVLALAIRGSIFCVRFYGGSVPFERVVRASGVALITAAAWLAAAYVVLTSLALSH